VYLTPEELLELGERIDAMVGEYVDRGYDPALRPEGARRVALLNVAYVAPVQPDQDGEPPAGGPE
jgi:hypothetical protein